MGFDVNWFFNQKTTLSTCFFTAGASWIIGIICLLAAILMIDTNPEVSARLGLAFFITPFILLAFSVISYIIENTDKIKTELHL